MSSSGSDTSTASAIRNSGSLGDRSELTLSDRVALEVGAQIVQGELASGQGLPTENELGALFQVSRSVIRDAIRTLSARGLVDVRQGHGMRVTEPSDVPFGQALIILLMRSSMTVGDLFAARAPIETELVPLAAEKATAEDLEKLHERLRDYEEAVNQTDWSAAQAAHASFHFSLLEAIHMPALQTILAPMQEIILLTSALGVEAADLPQVWTLDDARGHYSIVDALRLRNAAAVRGAMRSHFTRSQRNEFVQVHRQTLLRDSSAAQRLLREMLMTRRSSS